MEDWMLPIKKLASKLASLCMTLGLGAALAFGAADAAFAAPKKDFKLAWSIYVGWMPWQ
jgi:NitT/TauT family transport system substrate-binding protein